MQTPHPKHSKGGKAGWAMAKDTANMQTPHPKHSKGGQDGQWLKIRGPQSAKMSRKVKELES